MPSLNVLACIQPEILSQAHRLQCTTHQLAFLNLVKFSNPLDMTSRHLMPSLNILACIQLIYVPDHERIQCACALACLLDLGKVVQSSRYGLEMFRAKFECPSMHTALNMAMRMQKYSVHEPQLGCLNLVKHVVPSSRYGLEMIHADVPYYF